MRLESIKGPASTTVIAASLLALALASTSFGDEPGLIGRLFRQGGVGPDDPARAIGPADAPPRSGPTCPAGLEHPAVDLAGRRPEDHAQVPGQQAGDRGRPGRHPGLHRPDRTTAASSGCSSRSTPTARSSTARASTRSAPTPSSRSSRPSPRATSPSSRAIAAARRATSSRPSTWSSYERSLGRLKATSFSFSGNPQGCDHAVIHLNKVLENLETRINPAAPVVNAPAASGILAPELHLSSP